MNREKRNLANNLMQHLPEIDKALDVLAAHSVTTFAVTILQERLFDPALSKQYFPEVQNRSDFVAGAYALLETLDSIPEALKQFREELEKKK